ncbi:hypothetical protein Tco_0744910 [Tanacetum coccineum]
MFPQMISNISLDVVVKSVIGVTTVCQRNGRLDKLEELITHGDYESWILTEILDWLKFPTSVLLKLLSPVLVNSRKLELILGCNYLQRLVHEPGAEALVLFSCLNMLGHSPLVQQHQIKQLGGRVRTIPCNNCLRLRPYSGCSLDREWKKHKLNRSDWNIGDPHCGGDLVEVTDMSMRNNGIASRTPRWVLGAMILVRVSAIGSTGVLPEMGILCEEVRLTTGGSSLWKPEIAAHGDMGSMQHAQNGNKKELH